MRYEAEGRDILLVGRGREGTRDGGKVDRGGRDGGDKKIAIGTERSGLIEIMGRR
jgi:hypothetical protein